MTRDFNRLTEYLCAHVPGSVALTPDGTEAIVGPLAASARRHRVYSYESKRHTFTHSWLRAGYIRERGSLKAGILHLRYDPIAAAAKLCAYGREV